MKDMFCVRSGGRSHIVKYIPYTRNLRKAEAALSGILNSGIIVGDYGFEKEEYGAEGYDQSKTAGPMKSRGGLEREVYTPIALYLEVL
jgi:hypothetical protein